MSSSDRRLFLLSGLAVLAGCGFAPAYGPQGNGATLLGQVEVAAPDTRAAYLLTQELEGRLGRSNAPRYALVPVVTLRRQGVSIDRSNVTLRFNLLGRVDYTLRDLTGDTIVTQGTVENFTGYSTFGTPVANQAAERDAEARLMTMLADQLLTRLVATVGEPAQ
jgi:LPS-assembly lipoprotein